MQFHLFPAQNFPNNLIAVSFSILFLIVFFTEIRIYTKQWLSRGKAKDKGTAWLLILAALICIDNAFVLSYSGIGKINTIFSYFGILLVLLGFVIRQCSILTLGKYFTPYVAVHKKQKLIERGLYKKIRHPSYTGLFLEVFGLGLAISNILAAVLITILFLPVILLRIIEEERTMKDEFGKQYADYMKRTKKLIPFVY